MVHLDLVGLWVVLLWPPLLTHGPLAYLVLTLLLCVYPCYDDSHLMGFWYTYLSSFYFLVGPFTLSLYYKIIKCLLYGFINKTFMVLLINTFRPFIYLMVLFWTFGPLILP